jgi:hypothetical protein
MISSLPNPLEQPEWKALHREAILVSQLIGAGITALGRASYASGLGEYYTAFFGLSIGMERLAKLILVTDYALGNVGKLPDQKAVKDFGHKLKSLTDKAEQIARHHNLSLNYPKPTDPICWAALSCLDSFADISKIRYANFEIIGNPSFDPNKEPINKWWNEVVEPILDKHYRRTHREQKVVLNASLVNATIGNDSIAVYTNENGKMMDDLYVASERTGQTAWAQKYGRFYVLCIVRWLSNIFTDLTHKAVYENQSKAFFGHWEFFETYTVADDFLLKRKTWPLK